MSIIGNPLLLGGGGGGSVLVWDELDAAGGTIRHIEADETYGLEAGSATPTTSQQVINPTSGKYFSKFTVGAIPSNYKDTSDANATASDMRSGTSGYVNGSKVSGNLTTRSSSSLSASGNTVTVPAGIYDSQATKSVANGTAGTPTATKGTVSNHSVSVTPSVTNTSGYITGSTKTGTAVTVSASELVSGSETKTENGTYDVTNLASLVVNVSGGGGGGVSVGTATKTLTSASSSIEFTNLSGNPTSFAVVSSSNLATGASPYKTAAVVYDGTNVIGQYITNTSNAQMTYSGSAFSKSYSNGTLTITGTDSNFQANEYTLVYSYGGNSANIDTKQVQVGSGATSITFTGLEDEPMYWSCIFTSDIGTSSGYTRAHVVVDDGTSTYGMEMGSGSSATTNWTASYSNGSLTITSSSTSAGGYFHQPGYYQLTYAYGGTIEIETEPLSVTQNGTYTAPRGKAYTPVVVSVSGSGGASFATATMTNSSNQNTSISFTLPSGRTPKAFFARLTSQVARNSSNRYYYVFDMRWDGSSTGGVAGNQFYQYNGTLSNVTSGYSYSQTGTTFTLSSSGSRSAAPGSFYNGDYELVYVY